MRAEQNRAELVKNKSTANYLLEYLIYYCVCVIWVPEDNPDPDFWYNLTKRFYKFSSY